MKRSRIFIGAAALVLAAVSAFATTNAHRSNQYYYIVGNTCQDAPLVEFTCVPTGTNCRLDINGVSEQLYQNKPASGKCTVALQQQ